MLHLPLLQQDKCCKLPDKRHIRLTEIITQACSACHFVLQAVQEFGRIIANLMSCKTGQLGQAGTALLWSALCQRASIYEELEEFKLSLQDYAHLLKLQPNHPVVCAII